jgi:hypothetical protein
MRGRIAIVTDVGSGMRWTRRVAVCVIMHRRTACRGRSSRTVLIPRRWYHALMRKHHAQWWPKSPAHQEEYEAAVKTIAQGGPGCLGRTCGTCRLHFFRRRAMGAASSRPSLRPLIFEGERDQHHSGRTCREKANVYPSLFEVKPNAVAGNSTVIVRVGGRSSIPESPAISREAAAYWIPRMRGV